MPPRNPEPPQTETAYGQRVELALDSASIGTWEWDPEADRVVWSSNFERLHGFEPGAFGNSLAAYANNIHPEDRSRVLAALRSCAAGGRDYRVEYRLIAPGGEVHHVEANGRRISEGERGTRLIGVCRDVSERSRLLEREREARLEAESSDLHYRALAAMIPQQVWTATPDGALDFVNQRVTDYFGRSFEEVIGAGWKDVIHPTDLTGVVERWVRSLSTGEEYEVEFRLRRKDGEYRWHLGRAVPVRDAGGAIVRWLGTNTDIDEKKKMLSILGAHVEVADLLVNARSLEAVAGRILEAVCRNLGWTCAQLWVVDRDEGDLRRSAGWCGVGLAASEFEKLAQFDRMPRGVGLPGRIWESKAPAWIADLEGDPNFPRVETVRQIGLRSGFGFPLMVAGEVSAVLELFSTEAQPFEGGTVASTGTFGTQIGQFIQRIAAEQELSDALHRLRRLQNVTDAALAHLTLDELLDDLLAKICEAANCDMAVVLMADVEGGELYPVASFGTAVQLPAGLRLKVGESLSGMVAAERKTRILRNATTQESVSPELRALGVESIIGVPLISRDNFTGVLLVGALADITFTRDEIGFVELVAQRLANALANVTLYEKARETSRMKDQFLSMASHELKTPMTAVLGWIAVLRDDTDPAIRAEAIERIEQGARMQARLIEDFLDAARIREGKLLIRREQIDLASVLTAAARVVEPAAAERDIRLHVKLPEQPVIVEGDSSRLQQVVWNLLSNAIKFTPPGKNVRVRIEPAGDFAAILVEDEGAGIAPEFLTRIFSAFEQEEHGARAGGLGLGLHIVSSIVRMHGGTIEARSNGPGTGATFEVRLPVRAVS